MLSTETGQHLSSPEDPFEDNTLFSLMPNSFKGLISHNPSDTLSTEQALDRLLSQLALKKTAKDTEQANAILTSIPNLDTSGINVDTAFFCKHKIEQPEDIKEMAQEPALYKENIQPNENIPKSRIRREGTGRVSSRQPFTINLSSFGSNLNIQKDPIDVEDVDEFFAAVERQETADAILRKWRGEKSPVAVCSQLSRKTRVRRQGTGRKTKSKNFDLELLGDAEKYMQLDGEKLLVEEEEDPISTFSSGAKQACEMLIETGDRKTIKVLSTQESGHEECLSETVNGELQYQRDVRLDSDWKNCIQVHDQHNMAHVGDVDGLQVNPVQEKETLRGSETEETVNMPPKELFSTEYSAKSALHQLIKDYMKQDAVNTNPAPCSRSGLDINDIEKSYPKDLDCDTQYALQQSQTESSNTIHSQSLFTDEVKMIIQPQQFPKNFHLAGFDRTPSENFCQKPTEISSPLTSPTPPSKISAAFKSRRKHKSGIEGKIEDVCKPPLEKKDEEEAKVHASSPSYISRRLQTSSPSHISRGLHASSPSDISRKFHISSPSHISRKLHISSPSHISKKLHTSSPSHISGKLCLSNPLKKGECSGLRRLIFETSPRSPKQDEFNSVESLNDAEATDLVNRSKVYEENDRVDTVTTDVDLSNVAVLRPQKNTPVNSTEPPDFNVLVSEETEKNVLGSASGEQIEEFPVTLHKKNVKKAKRQLKNNTNSSVCDAHVENEIISNEIESKKRKYRKCDYQRRQSLTGAGTLWKSGVRRSQRIKSRPLEYWRGERFLFGRIHHSLRTVIGIKYTSPVHAQKNKHDFPDFKVKSYVDDQYSHLVEFAALH